MMNDECRILEVYPNTFSKKTEIRIQNIDYRLTIYDLTGRLIRTFPLLNSCNSFLNSVTWDGKDAGSIIIRLIRYH
ncbi:MAG: hypothetical protein QMD71_01415 [bacterium]|nr:hypothetical protein [bacterium]